MRHGLIQKIRESNLNFKKIGVFVLVGIICFCAGFFTDRMFMKHRLAMGFYGRLGMQRNMPRNYNNQRRHNVHPNNGAQTPDQSQAPVQNEAPAKIQPQAPAQSQ